MKTIKICMLMFLLCLISGCSNATKEELGLAKRAPNEFMVSPRAPLTIPPEYDLRPVVDYNDNSNSDVDMGLSQGEKKLLKKVGTK